MMSEFPFVYQTAREQQREMQRLKMLNEDLEQHVQQLTLAQTDLRFDKAAQVNLMFT